MDREVQRQIFHIILGIISIAILYYLGKGFLIAGVFFTILIGTILINLRIRDKKIPIVSWFEEKFERKDAHFAGWGSFWYAVGVLIAATYLTETSQIAAVIYILAFGDAVSTLIGRSGKLKIPFNRNKSLEGSIAFFIASLTSYIFIGPLAIALSFVCALAESMPIVDDNISIPIAAIIFLLVIK